MEWWVDSGEFGEWQPVLASAIIENINIASQNWFISGFSSSLSLNNTNNNFENLQLDNPELDTYLQIKSSGTANYNRYLRSSPTIRLTSTNTAIETKTKNISLFIQGFLTTTGWFPLYTSGSYFAENSLNLYVESYSYIPPEMTGSFVNATGAMNLYLHRGTSSIIPLYLASFEVQSGNIPLYLNASIIETGSITLVIPNTCDIQIGNIPLYTRSQ